MPRTVIGSARTVAGARTLTTARDIVNQNLVPNPGFETTPTFVAASNTTQRWIDGSAAGFSGLQSAYRWALANLSGTGAAQFDNSTAFAGTNSMKLSIGVANTSVTVSVTRRLNNGTDIRVTGIPVQPSTAYTMTFRMKTNYTSGDSRGAYIRLQEFNSAGATVTSTDSTFVKTTLDWTLYTISKTTAATTTFVDPQLTLSGTVAPSTLVMDAWFDSLSLIQTTSPTRTVA